LISRLANQKKQAGVKEGTDGDERHDDHQAAGEDGL
jgi:hypothetical protein